MGLKELAENAEMLFAISEKLSPLSEDVFAAAIGAFVDTWCMANGEPMREKGAEILGNVLATRDWAIDMLEGKWKHENY